MASRSDVVKKIMRLKLKLTDSSESATVDSGVFVLIHIRVGNTNDWPSFARVDRA